jgi:uncharacterized protein YndB with AHSA1/START domain
MIVVETLVNKNIQTIWECWTMPEHIVNWNFASEDWHAPAAKNDFKVGGKFTYTMAAKDGSMSFDFVGIYHEIIPLKKIRYRLSDDRWVEIYFEEMADGVRIVEHFEPETENPHELQQVGWQAILNNFKRYVESKID